MTQEDLWGEMPEIESLKTPLLILKEQSEILQEKTKGMLVGQITLKQSGTTFMYVFSIVAPTLNNYTYQLLSVRHDLGFYPITLWDAQNNGTAIQCSNEDEYKKGLSSIFSTEKNRTAISKLLTHISSTD